MCECRYLMFLVFLAWQGCDGGLPSHAFEYVRYNGGIDTELAYPYKGKVREKKIQ